MSKMRFLIPVIAIVWTLAGCGGQADDAPEGSIGERVGALVYDVDALEELVDGHAMSMHEATTLDEMTTLMNEYMQSFEQWHGAMGHDLDDMHQCSHAGRALDMAQLQALMGSMSQELDRYRMHVGDAREDLRVEAMRHAQHMLDLLADVREEAGQFTAGQQVACPHHGPHGHR